MSNWYERWVNGTEYPECGGVGHTGGNEMDDCPECTQKRIKADLEELQATFNLIWKAQQRAIQMWQQKTGQGLNWPNKASLIVWLMEENDSLRKQNQSLMANAFPLTSKGELDDN